MPRGRRSEASLVVEGQLRAVGLTDVNHPQRLGIRGRHRLLTVDRLDTRLGCSDDHWRMVVRPGADADNVELLPRQHLLVVGVDAFAAVLGLKRTRVIQVDVGQGDYRCISRGGVAIGVEMGHPET